MPFADEDSSDAAVGMNGRLTIDIEKNDERLCTEKRVKED
jgi:hypothetical protein